MSSPIEAPGPAGADLRGVGLLVDAPLAAQAVLEVLDHVGDVDVGPDDAGLLERIVEHAARGADERLALDVSRSPGCSPTSTSSERSRPSPNTAWVAGSHSGQARQS